MANRIPTTERWFIMPHANPWLTALQESVMSCIQDMTFTDTVTDALTGNSASVFAALTQQGPTLSLATLLSCQGEVQSVITKIATACDISNEAGAVRLYSAVKTADKFSNDATSRHQMAIYWTELSDDDFTAIGESRSCLVRHLQQRYHISRETAWRHVHIFFAQVIRHAREKP